MSNISFASTLRPILVAMAEPQFPEPTSATFSSGIEVTVPFGAKLRLVNRACLCPRDSLSKYLLQVAQHAARNRRVFNQPGKKGCRNILDGKRLLER